MNKKKMTKPKLLQLQLNFIIIFTDPLAVGPYHNKDILPHIDSYRLTLEDGNYI